MNRKWIFALCVVAVIGIDYLQRRKASISPAENAAVLSLPWLTDFDTARARSQTENKPLFIDFTGSDWCPPCKRLRKEVFSKLEFAAYAAQHLVLLEVDFPRLHSLPDAQQAANDRLAEKFNVQSFPTLIVLSPDGRILGRPVYRSGEARALIAELERLRPAP